MRNVIEKERVSAYIHYDNASIDRAQRIQQFVHNSTFTRLFHPPYSPDIAPSDYYLFDRLKSQLKGIDSSNDEKLKDTVSKTLASISQAELYRAIDSWIDRLQISIVTDGNQVF
ncbi:MAG: hypothetical protein EZS28_047076 [Streblomastix strix]|uniref:Tc1-like transposase DDE domain-containing protein n=1 Tax=Streblomastix strix TaxID=222440 RepID=A0A5J4TGL8_9EUKA|nr:MAG: hypothetical protein EZS28_047076 [Streblomastix strix]